MTRRRFFAPPSAFASDFKSTTLKADESKHLRDVLRLKVGDEVYVFDGHGREFTCRIAQTDRDFTELSIISEVEPARAESPLHLTLAMALLKGEKFDVVVQKATELGVTSIVPVITKLADIRLRDESDAKKRVLRWQRIALEAAKQSGRAVVPEVVTPEMFASLLETRGSEENLVLFSEREGQSLMEFKRLLPPNASSLFALLGSEGGWTDEELNDARSAGWSIVTLGGRTLRAETAAIAVTTLLQHMFGDLR